MGHGKHTGEAEDMRPGGPDETKRFRQNSPFRQLHEGGHALNHGYKNPVAGMLGATENHSYMNPMSHGMKGTGGETENAPQALRVANSVKSMSQQGAGKSGPMKLS